MLNRHIHPRNRKFWRHCRRAEDQKRAAALRNSAQWRVSDFEAVTAVYKKERTSCKSTMLSLFCFKCILLFAIFRESIAIALLRWFLRCLISVTPIILSNGWHCGQYADCLYQVVFPQWEVLYSRTYFAHLTFNHFAIFHQRYVS